MKGTLDVGLSATPLAREHRRLLQTALRRGEAEPEARVRDGLEREYPEALLAIAREAWLLRMAHEHRSASVFSQLLPQLIAAGAPLDYKTCALRMSMDELRHAGLCAEVARILGAEPVVEVDLSTEPLPAHTDASPRVAALRNVLFVSCLCETVAISVLSHERELVTEPAIHAAVAQLAADELLHGRFGWVVLADAVGDLSAEEREALAAYVGPAFAAFARDVLIDVPASATVGREPGDVLCELGVREPASTRALIEETIEDVIVPQLEALGLPAADAWRGSTAD